jgi:translocation and assembly module TamB
LRFSDSGAFPIDRLELTSRTARLETRGSFTAEHVADFTILARALPTDGGVTKAAEAELDSLVFDGSLKGALGRPRVNGSLKVAGVRADGSAVDRIEATLSAEPTGPDPSASRFALSVDAKVEGLLLADPALRRVIGARAALSFRGTLQPDNVVEVAILKIEGPTAKASYAGKVGRNTLAGTVQMVLTDIALFSDIASRPLEGSLTAQAALSGDPARKAITADIDLRTEKLALGQPALDRLLGKSPHFSGRLSQVYDGYSFDGVRFDGAEMVLARLEGRATARLADARLNVDLKNLAAIDPKLSGRAILDGRLTMERPDLVATLSATDAQALGRPIHNWTPEAAYIFCTPARRIRIDKGAMNTSPPLWLRQYRGRGAAMHGSWD